MTGIRRGLRVVLVGAIVAVVTSATTAVAVTSQWPTYHFDAGRSGDDTGEPSFTNLSAAWTSGGLDGAVYAEPLAYGGDVIVATENNTVYAFAADTGALRWSANLGPPRTSNFPCGDIKPLGITGTPVIDSGYLYVVAEVQLSSTSYAFHLAKIDPGSGAVMWNNNITPSGMDPNTQQERSALAVSSGNVVIQWGGLDGDCGAYHGFVETVAETNGAEQHQWNDTPGGNEGGMWATSGPAVDGSGNIYVATGNGSSTNINSYDFGNSLLKFPSSLGAPSFFAPGAPQDWASLNGSDTDLGSVGPSLLPGGLLFTIGKGGRGYLLNQSSLPNNSNPGGGENASNQVCDTTSNAAFSGMAVSGNVVYVPCHDGVAAVSIDSSTSFHTLWYQTSGGGAAPIVAGGVVWTLSMFGGTTVYGLDPSSGAIISRLSLPAGTQHFATAAAGYGRLFVPAGNRLAVFVAPAQLVGSANPPAAAADASGHQHVVWRGGDGNLWEAYWDGSHWTGPTPHGMGPLGSPPAIAIQPNGDVHVLWRGGDGNLWEAVDSGGSWTGPFRRGMGPLGSPPTVAAWGSEIDVFWQGGDGNLWEGLQIGGAWFAQPRRIGMGPLGSRPTAVAHSSGEQDVFWQGGDGQLWEAFWLGSRWNGPTPVGMRSLASPPSAAVLPSDEEDVFWRQPDGNIGMAAWKGSGWLGPTQVGMGPIGSPPAATGWGTEDD
ncbi:MAG: PQQ-binding-like beta-propeller repeat protein, partial [Candidatus Dormibacteraeota bacterium]|nr:PQQ-binding-like beta-propeller repeat protein [Candidatus Dormibacteraeota bacterium]